MTPKQSPIDTFKAMLKRPELLTLLLALVMSLLAGSGLAEKTGLPLPDKQIGEVVTIFWAIFVATVVEGKYKAADYTGGLRQLLNSRKVRLGLVTFAGVVLNTFLKPFGYALPDEAIVTIGNFILAAVGVIAGLDSYQASQWGPSIDAS